MPTLNCNIEKNLGCKLSKKISDICQEKFEPIINELGYELLEVEYTKKNDGQNMSFIIDKDGGILIEDCELVHKTIDPILDELNPTNDQPYILNVCSPGLDRPIKNQRDFLRNKNKMVEVKLYAPLNHKKLYIGKLVRYDDVIAIEDENSNIIEFEPKMVANILPQIKF